MIWDKVLMTEALKLIKKLGRRWDSEDILHVYKLSLTLTQLLANIINKVLFESWEWVGSVMPTGCLGEH